LCVRVCFGFAAMSRLIAINQTRRVPSTL